MRRPRRNSDILVVTIALVGCAGAHANSADDRAGSHHLLDHPSSTQDSPDSVLEEPGSRETRATTADDRNREVRAASTSAGTDCYSTFQPGLDPAADLARLTTSCAIPRGLTAITPVHIGASQSERAEAERLSFLGRAGSCYRFFSVGAPGVDDLDIALIDIDGRVAAADVSQDRWPIVPPKGLLCLHQDELFTIHAGVMQGSGSYLLQVWSKPIQW